MLREFWNDIKGNVKYTLSVLAGSAVVTGVVALTHGLNLWQQAALAGSFIFMLALVILSWRHRAASQSRPEPQIDTAPSAWEHARVERAQIELTIVSALPVMALALAYIYNHPHTPVANCEDYLMDMGFKDPTEGIWPLERSSLISIDGRMNVGPSHNPLVVLEIERFLEHMRLTDF
jgi:hypothetical protein